jgi:hypothetical protein
VNKTFFSSTEVTLIASLALKARERAATNSSFKAFDSNGLANEMSAEERQTKNIVLIDNY